MIKTVSKTLALGAACLGLLASPALAADATKPVKHYTFVVLTNPVPGKDAEYNDWYTNTHLHDLVKIPGIKSAQRFKIAPQSAKGATHQYLALYEIETDDLDSVQNAILKASGTSAMVISPAMDQKSADAQYFEEITQKVKAK